MTQLSKIELIFVRDEHSEDKTFSFRAHEVLFADEISETFEAAYAEGGVPPIEELRLHATREGACDDHDHGISLARFCDVLRDDPRGTVERLSCARFCLTDEGKTTTLVAFVRADTLIEGHQTNSSITPVKSPPRKRTRMSQTDYRLIDDIVNFIWPRDAKGFPLPLRTTGKEAAADAAAASAKRRAISGDAAPIVAPPWIERRLSLLLESSRLGDTEDLSQLMDIALRCVVSASSRCLV